ncbi:phosphotransferase family protein [Kribbella sp. NPDC020789]
MRWLENGSPETVAAALRRLAPELGDLPVVDRERRAEDDPVWWSASAVVGERFVAKFAWSEPAALRLAHEIAVLVELAGTPAAPHLPEVVASSTDPVLLVTRLISGQSLFEVIDSLDRESVGRQLADFLVSLHRHQPAAQLPPASLQPAGTDAIRARFLSFARPDQHSAILRWCDWTDAVLAGDRPTVLVHGDLHGGNQIWDNGRLCAVLDFETAGQAEPEYDLRLFPGTGPGVELLNSTLHHYQRRTGRALDVDRVLAWHLRTVLGDALWRSEAGVPLPDHRTAAEWVDDLAGRFAALRISP